MGFKDQIKKITDNWLIILLVVVLFLFLGISNGGMYRLSSSLYERGDYSYDGISYSSPMSKVSSNYYNNRDFAPDEEERKIMKTVSITTEVKRGTFKEEEIKMKSILESSDSYLLDENVNEYGEKNRAYYVGRYTIKVDAKKYDSVVAQLKLIGEVKSYTENKQDITGQYTNLEIELEVEKSKLDRYNNMLKESTLISDKITLNDKIFDQERTVKYLEDQIKKMDTTIDYSTLYLNINEKQSEYSNIVFVKFSQLIANLVGSINALLYMIFIVIPWAIFVGIIILVRRLVKKK